MESARRKTDREDLSLQRLLRGRKFDVVSLGLSNCSSRTHRLPALAQTIWGVRAASANRHVAVLGSSMTDDSAEPSLFASQSTGQSAGEAPHAPTTIR